MGLFVKIQLFSNRRNTSVG